MGLGEKGREQIKGNRFPNRNDKNYVALCMLCFLDIGFQKDLSILL